jgi:phenylacetate-CoA ligase
MRDPARGRELAGLKQRSWTWMLRNVILPAGDVAFGQRMMRRLRFLEEAQWWDHERLQAYRDCLLSSLVAVAYREVPFYRELMDSVSLRPDDIRGPIDLSRLPVVTKEMLRKGYPHLTTRKTGQKTYEARTSGSTGKNFCVLEDPETAGWYRASFLLALEWAGWGIGQRHLQTGMTLDRSLDRKLKDFLLRCHYVSAYDLTDSWLDQSLDALEKHSIEHLWGYPGSLYYLARRAKEKGWTRSLRSIVTWGDTLYPQYRTAIESAFKTRVFDTYGIGEGTHIAAQCGAENTYHIHSLDVVVEYLNNEGLVVPNGTPGNIVITRLHPGPMPLIRYRIGDVGVSGGTRRCECGRTFDILESITGRETDVVITPSGNRLIVHFFTGILEHFPEIDSFQVIQEERGSMLVRVVPTEKFSDQSRMHIIAALEEKGAAGMSIRVEPVPEIPMSSSGKRRFVISKL